VASSFQIFKKKQCPPDGGTKSIDSSSLVSGRKEKNGKIKKEHTIVEEAMCLYSILDLS
jgi:hypothetical protein